MKKRRGLLILIVLVLAISIGFALLSTTLRINGSGLIHSHDWDVYWDNLGDVKKSEGAILSNDGAGAATIDSTKKIVSFDVALNEPGDYYEFQVDAVNAGTLDAMIDGFSIAIDGNKQATLPDYLELTVGYADGTQVNQYDMLPKAMDLTIDPPKYTKERYKVRLEYSVENLDEEDFTEIANKHNYTINVEIPYVIAKDNANNFRAFNPNLGDYFDLLPTNATARTSYAGFSGSAGTQYQRLWRVINIKDNGEIEAVSEYISASGISFGGVDGYKNYIAGMQELASCYAKDWYTVDTRMMGYNGQTPVISNTYSFDGSTNSAQSTTSTPNSTSGTGQEYGGGAFGDTLYLRDYQLVSNVYKTDTEKYGDTGLIGYTYSGVKDEYWIASRKYRYNNTNNFTFSGLYMDVDGTFTKNYQFHIRYYYNGSWYNGSCSYAIRPIITLRAGLLTNSGTGTKTDPYTFK